MSQNSDSDSDITVIEEAQHPAPATPIGPSNQAAPSPGGSSTPGPKPEQKEELRRSNRKRRGSVNYGAKPTRRQRSTMSPGAQDDETKTPGPTGAGREAEGEDLTVLGQIKAMRASLESKIDTTAAKIDNLDDKLSARIDKQERELKKMNKKIECNSKRAQDTANDFAKLKNFVEKRSEDLPAAISKIVDEKLKTALKSERGPRHRPLGETGMGPSTSLGARNVESYWRARRSLRLWPITGENLDMPVRGFLKNVLKLCGDRVAALEFETKPLENKPQRPGAPAPPADVVLVTFENVETRDLVRAGAKNLAGVDAGLRLEIPDHLLGSFRVLNDLAFELKKKNGNLKRNIKFDDANLDLAMDVCPDTGRQWRTVTPGEARQTLAGRRTRKTSISGSKLTKWLGKDSTSSSDSEASEDDDFNDE